MQVAGSTPPDPDRWLQQAETTKGSWWPDFMSWLGDRSGEEVMRPVQEVASENWLVDKGPHRHFMAKEIFEQPESLARALRERARECRARARRSTRSGRG